MGLLTGRDFVSPLDTDLTLPYGLMYANEPSEALKKFLRIVKKLTW